MIYSLYKVLLFEDGHTQQAKGNQMIISKIRTKRDKDKDETHSF